MHSVEQLRLGIERATAVGDQQSADILRGRLKQHPDAIFEGYGRAVADGNDEAALDLRSRYDQHYGPINRDTLAGHKLWNQDSSTLFSVLNGRLPESPEEATEWGKSFMSKLSTGEVTPVQTIQKAVKGELGPAGGRALLGMLETWGKTPTFSGEGFVEGVKNVFNPMESPTTYAVPGAGKAVGFLAKLGGKQAVSEALRKQLLKKGLKEGTQQALEKDLVEKGVTTTATRQLGKNVATAGAMAAPYGTLGAMTDQSAEMAAGERPQGQWDEGAIAGQTALAGAMGAAIGMPLAGLGARGTRRQITRGTKIGKEFDSAGRLDTALSLQRQAAEASGNDALAREMIELEKRFANGTATSEDVIRASQIGREARAAKGSPRWDASVGATAAQLSKGNIKTLLRELKRGRKAGEITSADYHRAVEALEASTKTKGFSPHETLAEIQARATGKTRAALDAAMEVGQTQSELAKTKNIYQQRSKVREFLDQPSVQTVADFTPFLSPINRILKMAEPILAKHFPAGEQVQGRMAARANAEEMAKQFGFKNLSANAAAGDVTDLARIARTRRQLGDILSREDATQQAKQEAKEAKARSKAVGPDGNTDEAFDMFRAEMRRNPKAERETKHGGIQAEWAVRGGLDRNAVIAGLRILEKQGFLGNPGLIRKFREAYAANLNTRKMKGLGGAEAFYRIQDRLNKLAGEGVVSRMSPEAQAGFRQNLQSKVKGKHRIRPQVFQKVNRRSGHAGVGRKRAAEWDAIQTAAKSRAARRRAREAARFKPMVATSGRGASYTPTTQSSRTAPLEGEVIPRVNPMGRPIPPRPPITGESERIIEGVPPWDQQGPVRQWASEAPRGLPQPLRPQGITEELLRQAGGAQGRPAGPPSPFPPRAPSPPPLPQHKDVLSRDQRIAQLQGRDKLSPEQLARIKTALKSIGRETDDEPPMHAGEREIHDELAREDMVAEFRDLMRAQEKRGGSKEFQTVRKAVDDQLIEIRALFPRQNSPEMRMVDTLYAARDRIDGSLLSEANKVQEMKDLWKRLHLLQADLKARMGKQSAPAEPPPVPMSTSPKVKVKVKPTPKPKVRPEAAPKVATPPPPAETATGRQIPQVEALAERVAATNARVKEKGAAIQKAWDGRRPLTDKELVAAIRQESTSVAPTGKPPASMSVRELKAEIDALNKQADLSLADAKRLGLLKRTLKEKQ
jgi:hypothetical protein